MKITTTREIRVTVAEVVDFAKQRQELNDGCVIPDDARIVAISDNQSRVTEIVISWSDSRNV